MLHPTQIKCVLPDGRYDVYYLELMPITGPSRTEEADTAVMADGSDRYINIQGPSLSLAAAMINTMCYPGPIVRALAGRGIKANEVVRVDNPYLNLMLEDDIDAWNDAYRIMVPSRTKVSITTQYDQKGSSPLNMPCYMCPGRTGEPVDMLAAEFPKVFAFAVMWGFWVISTSSDARSFPFDKVWDLELGLRWGLVPVGFCKECYDALRERVDSAEPNEAE